jgi:sulfate/thiosulfate transport system substrate-binding protein
VRNLAWQIAVALGAFTGCSRGCTPIPTLIHVSYDPTRELFAELNPVFVEHWKATTSQELEIKMSHGGSSAQAIAVIEGVEADVVSLALSADVDLLASSARLLPESWTARGSNGSSPWSSTIVFVVRKGNPKSIHGFADLVKEGVSVVTADPKTSGAARWTYLAVWGWALENDAAGPGRPSERALAFLKEFYAHVPVLDSGARGASMTFAAGTGDVMLNWENEAHQFVKQHGQDGFEIVIPPTSILAEPVMTWVDRYNEQHGTGEIARSYVSFMRTEAAQEIAARHYFRVRHESTAERHRADFPELRMFTVEEVAGGWAAATKMHFSEGALFDRVTAERTK